MEKTDIRRQPPETLHEIGFLYGKIDHENHRGHKNPDSVMSWSFMLSPNIVEMDTVV